MQQKYLLKLSSGIISLGLIVAPLSVSASSLIYSADTTVSIGAFNLKINSGSTASSIVVGSSTLTVTTASGDSMTIESPNLKTLGTDNTTNMVVTCDASNSRIVITGAASVVITPSSTACVGGGGGSSSGSPAPAPAPAPVVVPPVVVPPVVVPPVVKTPDGSGKVVVPEFVDVTVGEKGVKDKAQKTSGGVSTLAKTKFTTMSGKKTVNFVGHITSPVAGDATAPRKLPAKMVVRNVYTVTSQPVSASKLVTIKLTTGMNFAKGDLCQVGVMSAKGIFTKASATCAKNGVITMKTRLLGEIVVLKKK